MNIGDLLFSNLTTTGSINITQLEGILNSSLLFDALTITPTTASPVPTIAFAPGLQNETEPIHLYHMHDKGHAPKSIKFFETQFDHVQTQLTFAFWFLVVTIAKIVLQRFENVKGILPDSALLIVLGSIFGGIFHFVFPDEEIFLQPDWFFLYFLPPIALEAGYFMPNREFFQNIGTITTYAVVGTLFNTATIGITLYMLKDYFYGNPSTIDLILFATLISAVDPVAVICVFEEVHVNQLLFICVFGESLLNDAVTIVLYHTLNAIAEVGTEHVVWIDYILAVISFLWVSLGGIMIGVVYAILTGAVTKWSSEVNVVQPLTCLLFPYLAYLCAESLGLSGILAIVVCGMLMKQYVVVNISEQSRVTVDYFMKTLSSSCEAVIFVFLGLSAVSKNHVLDLTFIAVTLLCCLFYRFIGVLWMTYILNLKRMQKINFVDQFIMGYGGIRGAVCYGLVMSLSLDIVGCKHMFATTTIIVIFFTVFVQGGTIKKLVTYLKVKQHEVYKKSVFEMIADNFLNHVTGGVEGIAGLHGEYWMRMTIERFNDKYIKPYIMIKQEVKAMKIVKHNEEIQVHEAVCYLKQHGSFAGMPTVQSRVDLNQAAGEPIANGGVNNIQKRHSRVYLNVVNRMNDQTSNYDSIPRNQSISGFVRDKFAEVNSPAQMYSRHYLHNDAHRNMLLYAHEMNDSKDENMVSEEACYKTYPYSKSSQKDLLIMNIRKASRSNTQNSASTNGNGSSRCNIIGGNCYGNNSGAAGGTSSQYSSPSSPFNRDGSKPKFMITSDISEYMNDETTSTNGNSGGTAVGESASLGNGTYSIGRFEVGSDIHGGGGVQSLNNTPIPLRKLSGPRAGNGNVTMVSSICRTIGGALNGGGMTASSSTPASIMGSNDESLSLLLPIEELDEHQITLTNNNNVNRTSFRRSRSGSATEMSPRSGNDGGGVVGADDERKTTTDKKTGNTPV